MRTVPIVLASAACLLAQEARVDEGFFAGSPKPVLELAAQRLETLKPKDAKVLAEAARFHFLAGQARKGEELLRFVDLLDPKDSDVQRLVGRALLAAGRRPQALAAYERVLSRDSPSRKAVSLAAIDLAEARLPKDAGRFMDAYLGLDPKDWETFIAFGRVYLRVGERRLAAPWFYRASVLQPGDDDTFLAIGEAFADAPRP
jgi:cytochrome c-type biogenesis protein CcmH/NrfG